MTARNTWASSSAPRRVGRNFSKSSPTQSWAPQRCGPSCTTSPPTPAPQPAAGGNRGLSARAHKTAYFQATIYPWGGRYWQKAKAIYMSRKPKHGGVKVVYVRVSVRRGNRRPVASRLNELQEEIFKEGLE